VIYDASLDELLQKVWDGQRISQAEALRLYHCRWRNSARSPTAAANCQGQGFQRPRQRHRHLHR
jgi:2-iminoacetate synthase ThiH